jgi:hypothetical protein
MAVAGLGLGTGHFSTLPAATDTTRLEATMAFVTVRNMLNQNNIIREIKSEICANRRSQVETWLTTLAGGDNPYISQLLFGRGHLAVKGSAAVYVSRCKAVNVVARTTEDNCTVEIPGKTTWRLLTCYSF